MKKLIVLIVTGIVGYYAYTHPNRSEVSPKAATSQTRSAGEQVSKSVPADSLTRAFKQQLSNVQVEASGVVDKLLSDDNDGSRHQRFIVRLASGQTVLIAHNIDLAPRVSPLSVGDRIQFSGEYEWNNKGGVVHWTHRDPNKRHQAGWIKRNGETFQ